MAEPRTGAPRSIQARLIAGAALSILLALLLAGSGLVWLFQRHIEQREMQSLEAKARELLPGLQVDLAGRPVTSAQPSDGRFQRPASGLYWQATNAAGGIFSPSLWDQRLDAPAGIGGAAWALRHEAGPFGRELLIVARTVVPPGSAQPVLVQFATDNDALAVSLQEFRREAALTLALLWAVLVAAAAVQVRLGLRPFARVRAELHRMRRHAGARLSGDHPQEILPLAQAVNALADARAEDLVRARRRAGDLAHSLKTPLAAIAAQSRRARAEGAPQAAAAIDDTLAVIAAALETELARARAALARDAGPPAPAAIAAAVEGIIAVLERTERGAVLVFDSDIDPAATVPVAEADLVEALGATLENAARHARRLVRVTAEAEPGAVSIHVDDDGPGLDDAALSAALPRGHRLDESGGGHGLGLGIVQDLVDATGGSLTLGRSPVGGLRVTLRWAVGG